MADTSQPDSYTTAKQAGQTRERDLAETDRPGLESQLSGRWGEHTEGGGVNVEQSKEAWTQLARRMSTASRPKVTNNASPASSQTAVEDGEDTFDLAQILLSRKLALQQEGLQVRCIMACFDQLLSGAFRRRNR